MASGLPSLSTDQIGAFVELSRQGQIRAAAGCSASPSRGCGTGCSRSRSVSASSCTERAAVRADRRVLTDQGRRFLPHAIGFLERAQELCRTFDVETGAREIRVASSQYLIRYLLIDVLKDFRRAAPDIHVRISTMNELEVEEAAAERSRSVDGRRRALRAIARSRLPRALRDELEPDHAATTPACSRSGGSRLQDLDRSAPHHLRARLDRPAARARRISRKRRCRRRSRSKPPARKRSSAWSKRDSASRSCRCCRAAPSRAGGASERAALDAPIRPIHSGVLVRRGERLSAAPSRLLDFIRSHFSR